MKKNGLPAYNFIPATKFFFTFTLAAQTLSSPGTPVTDCNTVSTSSQITNSNAAESAPERDFSVRSHSSKTALDGAMLIISSLIYIINFINAN